MEGTPKERGVQAVFFDLYNTLAHFWPPREEVQGQACAEFGLKASREGLTQGYAEADDFWARENARLPVLHRTQEEMARFFAEYERLVLEGAGLTVDHALAGRIWRRVRQIPYRLTLFDDVLPAMPQIRGLGLRLGLLSNLEMEGGELIGSLGLTPHLDFVVTPNEVGSVKPHPPMFLAALERAGVEPHQAVHVGDQYSSDVMGARNLGIRPVLMDRYGVVKEPLDCPLVHHMGELVELLRRGRT